MESGFSENDSRPLSPDSTKKDLAGCLNWPVSEGDPDRHLAKGDRQTRLQPEALESRLGAFVADASGYQEKRLIEASRGRNMMASATVSVIESLAQKLRWNQLSCVVSSRSTGLLAES